CQDAWSGNSRQTPRPRRRGDRVSSRREFITLLGGAAATWPLAARAQPERMRRIGVLMHLAADDSEAQTRYAAFLQGLQQAGWSAGRNVRIDTRWAASEADRRRYAGSWLRWARTSCWRPTARPRRRCRRRPRSCRSYSRT